MIASVLSEAVLLATIALGAMPLVARRFRDTFGTVELTRFNAATMSSGMLLLFIALVACAVPVVAAITGASVADRHFFPGDTLVGWFSGLTAMTLIAIAAIGTLRTNRIGRRLTIEAAIGYHIERHGYDLVVLDSSDSVAYAVNKSTPQVVLTTGLIAELAVDELVSVVEHEAAHIRLNHKNHLRLVGLLEPVAALRPAGRLINTHRLSLERAADRATSNHAATASALLKLTGVRVAAGVAGFTAGDVIDRLEALNGAPHASANATKVMLYGIAASLILLSVTTLAAFWL